MLQTPCLCRACVACLRRMLVSKRWAGAGPGGLGAGRPMHPTLPPCCCPCWAGAAAAGPAAGCCAACGAGAAAAGHAGGRTNSENAGHNFHASVKNLNVALCLWVMAHTWHATCTCATAGRCWANLPAAEGGLSSCCHIVACSTQDGVHLFDPLAPHHEVLAREGIAADASGG